MKAPRLIRIHPRLSVQPEWCIKLPLQQQSVLFLGSRGPDGVPKRHPCKAVHIAYRACVFLAGKYGRELKWGERADTFMSLDVFCDRERWDQAVKEFFDHHDELAHHYVKHLMHGAQILGYKHPDKRIRARWHKFYLDMVEQMHLEPESEKAMDRRLGDWGRKDW